MRSNLLVVAALCLPLTSAADIKGTFPAEFSDFNEYGVPIVALRLDLTCSLQCPASSPVLHYAVKGGAEAHFIAEDSQTVGTVSSSFLLGVDPSGKSAYDSEAFPPGANFEATAKAVTCYCGNAVGQGGYIDITTPKVSVPPWIQPPFSPPTVGEEMLILITSAPRGPETLDVEVTGAGIAFNQQYSAAEAGGSRKSPGTVAVQVTATRADTVTVTAIVSPGGVEAKKKFLVADPARR
jgi:hypothetical protein